MCMCEEKRCLSSHIILISRSGTINSWTTACVFEENIKVCENGDFVDSMHINITIYDGIHERNEFIFFEHILRNVTRSRIYSLNRTFIS